MPYYKKKPVVIEAQQWDGTAENAGPIIDWILENEGTASYTCPDNIVDSDKCHSEEGHTIMIQTLEGPIRASAGDFVIRGVQGEFYPCKPDIFAESYDEFPLLVAEG